MSRTRPTLSRRTLAKAGGALFVSLATAARASAQVVAAAERVLGKTNDLTEVDAFIAIHSDGSATLFCGKVDLGQGLRIAVRQMMAEELAMAPERIALVEGDSALTPDQGPTAGSTGIMRGGVQIRQAAATARAALVALAAERLGRPAAELDTFDGEVRPIAGGPGIGFGALIGDRRFARKLDARATLRDPRSYRIVGKPLARPDVPAKVTGRHPYVHDFKLPGMLHARVIRPAAVGARVARLDAASIAAIPGARVLRINDFVAVVAEDEWACERARRALKVEWTAADSLVGHDGVEAWMRAGPFESDETITKQGDARAMLGTAARKVAGRFYWPLQSHASMGPSCAVAELRDGKATIWSASQATHRLRRVLARILQMPAEDVRVIYLDGAGCYGMNGHDDASADAALIARATGRPVRVQWTRADEHGWDPKGPPQLLDIEATLDPAGGIGAWRTEMWLPRATANLPNIPLLGPADAGIAQPQGISTGLISQNARPPYACASTEVLVHWLKDSPLRPSNIRAPGKVANTFAVESMVDDLAAAAGTDPVAFRLAGLKDPRGIEVIERAAKLIGWQSRPSPAPAGTAIGRGMAYVHYKFNETYVAIAMEASVDRASGAIRVHRIACAHDCGLVVNPDGARQQIEGNIYQTLSRTLLEEVTFDRSRVTSIDWTSYPILAFPDVPELLIDLVDRPTEPPLGAGEAACSPVPAALANAIFDATGARLQTVPFTPDRVKRALATGRA